MQAVRGEWFQNNASGTDDSNDDDSDCNEGNIGSIKQCRLRGDGGIGDASGERTDNGDSSKSPQQDRKDNAAGSKSQHKFEDGTTGGDGNKSQQERKDANNSSSTSTTTTSSSSSRNNNMDGISDYYEQLRLERIGQNEERFQQIIDLFVKI